MLNMGEQYVWKYYVNTKAADAIASLRRQVINSHGID